MSPKYLALFLISWLKLILLYTIPLLVLFIRKLSVIFVAKCFHRDLKPLKSGLDVMQCPGPSDAKSVVNIGLLCKIQGEINLQQLQATFTEKFLKISNNTVEYEKFNCSLVSYGGYMFAKRLQQIDINQLIYVQNYVDEEKLQDFVTYWIHQQYKKDSPCWEIVVVPLKSSNETAICFKIHHALADGYSLLYILDHLTDNTSPYLVKDFQQSFTEEAFEILQGPYQHYLRQPTNPQQETKDTALKQEYRNMLHFTRLNLQLLKHLRRIHNVQFGSLIMSLMTGAVRRYLMETNSFPMEFQNCLEMAISLPWPNHPSKNPKTPPSDKMCNHATHGEFKMSLQEANPIIRLKKAEESLLDYQRQGLIKFHGRFSVPLLWLLPTSEINSIAQRSPGVAGTYTTIVGGDYYTLLGKPLTQIHPLVMLPYTNYVSIMSLFTLSHSNHLEVTLSTNSKYFPDPHGVTRILEEYLPQEINLLWALTHTHTGGNY